MDREEMIALLGKAIEKAIENERNYDCLNDSSLLPHYVIGYLQYAGVTLTYDAAMHEQLHAEMEERYDELIGE